ncbi:TPA: DUF1433 domain-containing protein [Streptococcus equi subsp. zooepidemicus]|nr:DUF1433 domain-containing protein [Streptococcus equi subsp. zooepidemicus]HEL0662225.1 DUF1433 domain-containing protein [Streptococcus equi subsp. zooepidemicus]HEL1251289.1 DUF1433 domain-containing protein [Streptococcus equi subsp. zooepidemicus]HEL1549037.1 DUF1433 domain-containing protein [Streptococcus equi subsp. zooepidemicus]
MMKKQQNKRRKLIGIVTLITILGGILTMNWLNGERLKKEYREQERIVKYVASNYEGIEKVEFIEFFHNNITGTYSFYAIINDKIKVDFTLWGLNGDIDVNSLDSRNYGHFLKKLDKPNKKPDVSNIKIYYLEN